MVTEDYLLENNPYGYAEDRIDCMNDAMFSFADGYSAIFKYAFLLFPFYLVVVAVFVLYKIFWFAALHFSILTKNYCFEWLKKKNKGAQVWLEILTYPLRILAILVSFSCNLLMLLLWGLLWLIMLPFGTYKREREGRYKRAFGDEYAEKMKDAPKERLFYQVRWDI